MNRLTNPEPITLAMVAAALQVLASVDIRNAPPSPWRYEPPTCSRCNDTKTVADSEWEPSWLWQRYRPAPQIPCPDCREAS